MPTTPGNSLQSPPRAPHPLGDAVGLCSFSWPRKAQTQGCGRGRGVPTTPSSLLPAPAVPPAPSHSQLAARRSSPEAEDPRRAGIFFATGSPPDPGRRDHRPVSSPAPRGGLGGTKPSARAPAARTSAPALSCRHGGSPRGDHGLPGPAEPAGQDETAPRRLPHPPVRPSASASIPHPCAMSVCPSTSPCRGLG